MITPSASVGTAPVDQVVVALQFPVLIQVINLPTIIFADT